jgi:uncharacterized protein
VHERRLLWEAWLDALMLLLVEGMLHSLFQRVPSLQTATLQVGLNGLCLTAFALWRVQKPKRETLGLVRSDFSGNSQATYYLREILVGVGAVVALYAVASLVVLPFVLMKPDAAASQGAAKAEALQGLVRVPLLQALGFALFAGVYEEVVFRGFLFEHLRRGFAERTTAKVAVRAAAIVSALLFALGHVYQGPVGVVQALVVGLGFAFLRAWRGSLWSAIAAHACIDAIGMLVLHRLR